MFESLQARWGCYGQVRQSLTRRFVLAPNVHLVQGKKHGAIYDLNTGRIYSVTAAQVLDLITNQGRTPLEVASEGGGRGR